MSRLDQVLERAREGEDEDEPEGEQAEQETPAEPEPDGEPEPAAAPPALSFDPAKMEKELGRHAKAMEALLGDGWVDMEACETCGTAGFVPKAAVAAPEMRRHPELQRCDTCNGWGRVLTPSLDPQYAEEPCMACTGKGYLDAAALKAAEDARRYAAQAAQPVTPPTPFWNPATQRWETPDGQALMAVPNLAGGPVAPVGPAY